MSDFPISRIRDFLHGVVPFDSLSPQDLERVVNRMEIAYFPRGEVILASGGPPADSLYVIMSGSVRVTLPQPDQAELLVDVRGEGDTFGAVSLLQGIQALFSVTSQEDLLTFLLPASEFRTLVQQNPVFQRHFSYSLARNIQAVRREADEHLPAMTGTESLGLDAVLMQSRVAEMMSPHVLTCLPNATIQAAARRMATRKVGSIVVEEENGAPLGLVTDTDLRVRVVAAGVNTYAPVTEIMTKPLITISPAAFAFEAMMEMARHGVHHLVVVDNQRVVGIISDHDLKVMTGASPVGVVRQIDKVDNLEDLSMLPRQIERALEMLLRLGGSAQYMLDLVTEFNDRLTLKVLSLVEDSLEHSGMGSPPVPYCWLALGSHGRREQVLPLDQDHALVYANVPPERQAQVKGWFVSFARRVTEGLDTCGFNICQDGSMAANPRWCLSESEWEDTFQDWVQNPDAEPLKEAAIFFDFRPVYAETGFPALLRQKVFEAIERNRGFLSRLARSGPYQRPPLGFLRQFVVEKNGEYRDHLNLKTSGLAPVVNAARVMALEQKVETTSTLERLAGIAQRGLINDRFADDLHEAYSFIMLLRIARYLEAVANESEPGNFLDPGTLNKVQRKMLKESFAVISSLQDFIDQRYRI